MHMDIFNDDAFSSVEMTSAIEDFDFAPGLIGSMGLFEFEPISTEMVSVERRGNELAIIQTSERGEPLDEADDLGKRNIRAFQTRRIAKGRTVRAAEIQNLRAFGRETELETAIKYIGRRQRRLITDVEATWESQMLGAVQGVVLDADSTVIIDWFAEWGLAKPAEINFALTTDTTEVEVLCRQVQRTMIRASKGKWAPGTRIIGLCGDSFFDKLTTHKSVKDVKLAGAAQAAQLLASFGVATESMPGTGSFAMFQLGGITFINYRSTDDFDDAAADAGTAQGTAMLGIPSTKCKFFPAGAPGLFQETYSPLESFEMANTEGRKLYSMLIRDEKRDFWVRPEVYSYPLYICTSPEMLLSAKEA